MILKMKSRTCNNSFSNIKSRKCSVERINNLSYRIQSLQDDINKIQNIKKNIKVNKNKNSKIQFEKDIFDEINDTDVKDNLKDKSSINKTFIKNPASKENKKKVKYLTKNHSKKEIINSKFEINKEKIIFKRINFRKNKINGKRNFFLKINSNLNKAETLKIYKKNNNVSKIPNKSYNFIKENNLISTERLNINSKNSTKKENFEENKNSSDKNTLSNNGIELNNLKKRIRIILEQKNELNKKLLMIKNKNKNLENKIKKEQNKNNNIIENIILLNKKYLLFKNQKKSKNLENNLYNLNNKSDIKDILFNIIDIKFEYENNILYEKFIEHLNKLLLNKTLSNTKNSCNNIINKIKRLLHLKTKLQNLEEKYTNKKIDKAEYYNYFTSLLTELNLKSFKQLKEYIRNLFIKNIQENKRMKEILNGLINDNEFNLMNKKEQTPKMKYIHNAFLLNKNRKNENNKNIPSNHTNIIKEFRNNRENSFNSHGICYNSFAKVNKKRNKNFFRREANNNILIKFNSMRNDNDINLLKEEEFKNMK